MKVQRCGENSSHVPCWIHCIDTFNFPLSTFNFQLSTFNFFLLFFIPSDPNHISFFDICSRTILMLILLPGVPLRSPPGYQDFATTWLNPGIALVRTLSTRFIMRFIASPFLRFFVSPSAKPRGPVTLHFQFSAFNFQLSTFFFCFSFRPIPTTSHFLTFIRGRF